MQAPFHRRNGNAKECGDSLQWHLVEESKAQGSSIVCRQFREGIAQFSIRFRSGCRGRKRAYMLKEHLVQLNTASRAGLFSLCESKSVVAGDDRQPCREPCRILNRWQRLECEEQ